MSESPDLNSCLTTEVSDSLLLPLSQSTLLEPLTEEPPDSTTSGEEFFILEEDTSESTLPEESTDPSGRLEFLEDVPRELELTLRLLEDTDVSLEVISTELESVNSETREDNVLREEPFSVSSSALDGLRRTTSLFVTDTEFLIQRPDVLEESEEEEELFA